MEIRFRICKGGQVSYVQLEEPKYTCPKCKKVFSLNRQEVQYGLFQGGILARCSVCFEQMKHNFWLRVMAEEIR